MQNYTRLLVSEICYSALTDLFHCHDWNTDPSETVKVLTKPSLVHLY